MTARTNKPPTNNKIDNDHANKCAGMKTPPIVSPKEWEAARQVLLVKEKELTRARDAMGRRTAPDAVDVD